MIAEEIALGEGRFHRLKCQVALAGKSIDAAT
jgi:hypothetical protein